MALVLRAKRVAFMAAGTDGKLDRMTQFTTMTPAKNPKEYTRQYVDESTETSDVIGYAPSIEYSFDFHTENAVHEALAAISDGELLGSDTHVEIVTVDLFSSEDAKPAIKRTYAVIPSGDSDGVDALKYSGTFKAVSGIVKGTATSADGWKTCTFTEATAAAE